MSDYLTTIKNLEICLCHVGPNAPADPCDHDIAAAEARDAALDAAEFHDPREQARQDYESDLRHEYSKPEYHDEYLDRNDYDQ